MTPRERLVEMRALMDIAARALERLQPAEGARRLAVEDRLRRESIDALLRGLASQRPALDPSHGG